MDPRCEVRPGACIQFGVIGCCKLSGKLLTLNHIEPPIRIELQVCKGGQQPACTPVLHTKSHSAYSCAVSCVVLLQICIFMGKTDTSAPAHLQQSMVLVPMRTPGVKIIRPMLVFGWVQPERG
jgi:hypothetical protein